MPDQDVVYPIHRELAIVAEDVFDSLATQFPVCMASDEFHFFPQARARTFDWSHWDDFSPAAMAKAIDRLRQWGRELDRQLSLPLSSARTIDAAMLHRVVLTLHDQFAFVRVYETQPTFYLTIIGVGMAEAFEAGVQAVEARLESLPAFLDLALRNLNHVPVLFRDLGIDMLVKQQQWLNSLSLTQTHRTPINDAFHRLGNHLRQAPVHENFRLPVERYEQIAFDHMGCQLTPDDIARELELEIEETRSILEQSARSMAPGRPWQAVVGDLPRPPMPSGGIGDLYRHTLSALARHCSALRLITAEMLQKCPVTVEKIPDYMRPVRSNAAYSMPPVHPPQGGTFFIQQTGKEARIPADYRLLAAHETFPGHHLLDTCRWGHKRPVRRHIEFPIFYEGWASFTEELMFETEFFTGPINRMLMAKRRFWRAIRGQIDFDIHMHRRTLDEAAAFLSSQGMVPQQAMAMVRRYSLKPGYQLSYTIGRRRFCRLYEDVYRQEKNPVAFARGVLAQGEIGFTHLEQVLRQGG